MMRDARCAFHITHITALFIIYSVYFLYNENVRMMLSFIIYILTVVLGFTIYRIWYLDWSLSEHVYHGPKASDITQCVYHDAAEQKYYQFRIKTFVCPPSVNNMFNEKTA
jgi:hypothetical protein